MNREQCQKMCDALNASSIPTNTNTHMNTTNTIEETTALILAGQGYDLTVSPEAEKRKADLLVTSRHVTSVESNDDSGNAQRISRALAAMRIEVEKCRKEVKEPVNRIGKLIDSTAKNFLAEILDEEARITKLVGEHAEEVARLKREKEEAERRAFEEARAAREAAEAAAAAAATTGKISDVIAARQAEEERKAMFDARMAASEEVATTNVAPGVRFVWDFEVEDIHEFYRHSPEHVTLTPKRAEILAEIKRIAETNEEAALDPLNAIGLRIFKRPVVSSR
jgi:hypothetical protein